MSWLAGHWLDLLGWLGSVLLIWSVLQAGVLRLRALNLLASAVLSVFNGLLEIWPMVAMNFALCLINLWHLRVLLGHRHDPASFAVLAVRSDDAYLRHVLRTHAEDMRRFQPDLDLSDSAEGRLAFLVQRGDETVGVVLLRAEGDCAKIELDWVSRRYRDLSPGEFVWRRSGLLRQLGLRRVETSPRTLGTYYGRIGFRREGNHWSMEVPTVVGDAAGAQDC